MEPKKHWYIACTKSCQDRHVADTLEANGLVTYVAVRKVERRWSDRTKIVDQFLIPRIVFVYCTEKQRRESLTYCPYITHYMSERRGAYRPAKVPDDQMRAFQLMVGWNAALVEVTERPLQKGDRVKVVDGAFAGLEGELVRVDGKNCVAVQLSVLGSAITEVDLQSIVRTDL